MCDDGARQQGGDQETIVNQEAMAAPVIQEESGPSDSTAMD